MKPTINQMDVAMMVDKPLNYTEDGELLYSAPLRKQVLCTGHMRPADVAPIITVRLPISLTPAAFVAYLRQALPSIIVIDDVDSMSEGEFLNFQLNALRNSTAQPIVKPLTDEQFETLKSTWIGSEEFDCRGEW